ncbi:MAG: hypothetical protein QXU32_00275 [Nitrososphaerales archaeon]
MDTKHVLVALLLISLLVLGGANYSLAQTKKKAEPVDAILSFHLQFMTVPQKLIHNTDASLLIYAVDNNGKPLPVRIPTVSITSSDPSVVMIKNISSSENDNSVKVDIHAGKIGSAIVTAAANGFLSSSVTLEVVGDAYKPEGLVVKAVPSSFAHFGPYNGYVSVQLVNFFGNPVLADEDIVINLSSSDPSVVNLRKEVTIKKGENFVVNEFTVIGSGITLLQAEVPGKWKESAKITVSQPQTPLELKFYAAPQIAPARQGQIIHGFVQLQDASGVPVKADRDISVNVISDSSDVRGGTGIIKKGTTTAILQLAINTNKSCFDVGIDRAPKNDNFDPCIELVAVAKGFKSQSQLIELRTPVTRVDLSAETRFDDPAFTKIDPVIFPTSIAIDSNQQNIEPVVNMPILSDGTEKPIGVVQLMRFVDSNQDGQIDLAGVNENGEPCPAIGTTCPVIPFTDISPVIESDDDFKMEIKTAVIPKGRSSSLLQASVGYQGGDAEVASIAEFFGQTFTQFKLHGHSGISLAAEPVISKIMARSDFPYMVYFKDSNGISSYSIGDMTLSISKTDKPEAEIGTSKTTTEILAIESGMIVKGSPYVLLHASSKGKGSSTMTIESSVKDMLFSTTNTLTMSTQLPEKLGFFVPNLILGNAKYTVPLQVLDKNGFPIKTVSDVEILFVPSIRNIISAPETIMLPKGEYYATILIEAKNDGKTEITALANNFQSTKLNAEVTTPTPTAVLTPSSKTVQVGNQFSVTLNSKFNDAPVSNLNVKWSSDKATLVVADQRTNEQGNANAKFLMKEASPFVVRAEISGPGYKTNTVTLNMQTESLPERVGLNLDTQIGGSENAGVMDLLTKNPYIFVLPAIGGVVFWLVKTERISLPFDRLLERFRESED